MQSVISLRYFEMKSLPVMIFSTILTLSEVLSSPQNGVPTKAEISKVMNSVEDIFQGMKQTFITEMDASEESIPIEVEKLAEMAKGNLDLIEEMSLFKLSCLSPQNNMCMTDYKTKIQKVLTEGDRILDKCISQTKMEIRNSSRQFVAETNAAASKGQSILNSLDECMLKTGLQQFSCYRKVMNNDVDPLRDNLLYTIRKHQQNHMNTLKIRSTAYNCMSNVLTIYKKKVAEVMTEALKC